MHTSLETFVFPLDNPSVNFLWPNLNWDGDEPLIDSVGLGRLKEFWQFWMLHNGCLCRKGEPGLFCGVNGECVCRVYFGSI